MFSRKIIMALALMALSGIFIINAYAQWSPSGMTINFADMNFAGAQGQSSLGIYAIGGTTANSPDINSSPMNNSSMSMSAANSSKAMPVLDLSKYATGRRNNDLTGFTNIMYPFAESRGSTAGTAGAGGCGCG